MTYLPLIIIVVALLGVTALSRRRRAQAMLNRNAELEAIRFGTEVQTMSGLYGTVVGLNDDDTVQLAIAPGVEVKWARAALRDVASLPKPPSDEPIPQDESGESPESGDNLGP